MIEAEGLWAGRREYDLLQRPYLRLPLSVFHTPTCKLLYKEARHWQMQTIAFQNFA